MVESIPVVSILCLTLVSIVALGKRDDGQTANKAIDTLKDVIKSFFSKH